MEVNQNMDVSRNEEDHLTIIQKLFAKGLEEVLQMIFLYLDPKSLKNSKLTCSQWKEFIDRRIWKSPSAKSVLQEKLLLNWKTKHFDEVPIQGKENSYIDRMYCDNKVIVFRTGKLKERFVAICAYTLKKLYSFEPEPDLLGYPTFLFSFGDNFIAITSLLKVRIINKVTGELEFQHTETKPKLAQNMVGDVLFVSEKFGEILMFSKNPTERSWSVKKRMETEFISILSISGDENKLVIGLEDCIRFWDVKKEMETGIAIAFPRDFRPYRLQGDVAFIGVAPGSMFLKFLNPFVFVALKIHEPNDEDDEEYDEDDDIKGKLFRQMRIYNTETGELIRLMELNCDGLHFNGWFVTFKDKDDVELIDVEELRNKKITNENLRRIKYEIKNGAQIVTTKTKMIITQDHLLEARRRVIRQLRIFDFWTDRDYEVSVSLELAKFKLECLVNGEDDGEGVCVNCRDSDCDCESEDDEGSVEGSGDEDGVEDGN